MKLEKLTIYVEKEPFKPIEVMFNPNQLTFSKIGWQSSEKYGLEPVDGAMSLSLELFFDTSLPQPALNTGVQSATTALVGRSTLIPAMASPEDVRKYTKPIMKLTKPRGNLGAQPRPPICQLCWGIPKDAFFQGVLKSVTQTFSRFLENGTPVRATLSCEFEEWEAPEYKQKVANQIDDPLRIVRRGETLSSIAAEEYGDPSLWRVIATANGMEDPRQLVVGQQLMVPPLRLDDVTWRG